MLTERQDAKTAFLEKKSLLEDAHNHSKHETAQAVKY